MRVLTVEQYSANNSAGPYSFAGIMLPYPQACGVTLQSDKRCGNTDAVEVTENTKNSDIMPDSHLFGRTQKQHEKYRVLPILNMRMRYSKDSRFKSPISCVREFMPTCWITVRCL